MPSPSTIEVTGMRHEHSLTALAEQVRRGDGSVAISIVDRVLVVDPLTLRTLNRSGVTFTRIDQAWRDMGHPVTLAIDTTTGQVKR